MMIRPATPDDAPVLSMVEVTTWRSAYQGLLPDSFLESLSIRAKTEEWHTNLLKHGIAGQKRVRVALDQGHIVGFVRVGTGQDIRPVGLVYLLYVLPAFWNQKIGTALMQAGLLQLLDLGHTTATLWVLRDNTRARHFYERLGWVQDGRITDVDYGAVSLQALCYQYPLRPELLTK